MIHWGYNFMPIILLNIPLNILREILIFL